MNEPREDMGLEEFELSDESSGSTKEFLTVRELEEQSIINGEFDNKEILLKRSDQNEFHIYHLRELEKNRKYVTPSGNMIQRIGEGKMWVNSNTKVAFVSNTLEIEALPLPLKKQTNSPILRLDPDTQIDLTQNETEFKSWNENMSIFTQSKLLSNSQEEDDGEWLFSPNIRRSKKAKSFDFQTIMNFDMEQGTDGPLHVLSPPPEEHLKPNIFSVLDSSQLQFISPIRNPQNQGMIRPLAAPQQQEVLSDHKSNGASTWAPTSPRAAKSPNSVSSPLKGLDYMPKVFHPSIGSSPTKKVVRDSKSLANPTRKPVTQRSSNVAVPTKKIDLQPINQRGTKSTNIPSLRTPQVSGHSTLSFSNRTPVRIAESQKKPPVVSVSYAQPTISASIKAHPKGTNSLDRSNWKLIQWRKDQMKDPPKELVRKPEERRKPQSEAPRKHFKTKPLYTPRGKCTIDDLSISSKTTQAPSSSTTTLIPRLPTSPRSPQSRDCEDSKYEVESIVTAHSILEDLIEKAVVFSTRSEIDQEEVILYGVMENIPQELCRNIRLNCLFRCQVDVELYDQEHSSEPVFVERSVTAFMELVDSIRTRSRDSNISAENIVCDEDQTAVNNAYYYLSIGNSVPLPDCLFEKVVPLRPRQSFCKVKALLKSKFWYTIKPEMDDYELVSKVIFTTGHIDNIPQIREFIMNRGNRPNSGQTLNDLFDRLLKITDSNIITSPMKELKKQVKATPKMKNRAGMDAVTLPFTPTSPNDIVVDVDKLNTPPDERNKKPVMVHPPRSEHTPMKENQNISSCTPPTSPTLSPQVDTVQVKKVQSNNKISRYLRRIRKKFGL